jgi:uncharacterized protein (TIGR02996 family)
MPLYEHEEGESRKFHRVDRDGTRIHLHWGRIGTAGEKQTLELASEREAKAEYDRQVLKRREHGYRLVLDESLPHDPEAARKERLARTAPLSKSPRFYFVNKKAKSFVWVEARESDVLTAEGPLGKEADAPVKTETCASPAAAVRKRDASVAKLLGKGYALADFGVAETKPKAKALPKSLKNNIELEAHIRAAPFDEARWAVLEDWLLEQDDPRAELIRLEKSGARGDAAQERGRLAPLLLGQKVTALHHQHGVWRAGYALECSLHVPKRKGEELVDAFIKAPATRLLRSLTLEGAMGDFRRHLEVLGLGPFVKGLRSLTLELGEWEPPSAGIELDGKLLAAFTNLERLVIRGAAPPLVDIGRLPMLQRFEHRPTHDDMDALLAEDAFPRLKELVLDLELVGNEAYARDGSEAPALSVDELRPLLDRKTAPLLETLAFLRVRDATIATTLRALVGSALLPQLRSLAFGWAEVAPEVLRADYGRAFDHLATFTLPTAPVRP